MRPCAAPECAELIISGTYCDEHRREQQNTSRRKYQRNNYGPEWDRIRLKALERDGHRCQWVEHGKQCTRRATEVDHTVPFRFFADRHTANDLGNLKSLCKPHHSTKTKQELQARRTHEAQPQRSRADNTTTSRVSARQGIQTQRPTKTPPTEHPHNHTGWG